MFAQLVPPGQWVADESKLIKTQAFCHVLGLISRHRMELVIPTEQVGLLVFTLAHPSIRHLVSANLLRFLADSIRDLPLDDLERDRLLASLDLTQRRKSPVPFSID